MITAVVVGDEAVVLKLATLHPKVQANLERVVRRKALELVRYIKGSKLSGQVLKTKTGTLRRKINQKVEASDTAVTGFVGAGDLPYAPVHEYGLSVTIREHLRTIKQAFGRRLKAPKEITVRSHTVKYPERSFMRSALRDMGPEIKEALRLAVFEEVGKW